MATNLSETAKLIRVSNAVAAGSTDITPSAGVDTQGFDSCEFLFAFGTITSGAVTGVRVQQSSDDGVADTYADLESTAQVVADTRSNDCVLVDIHRPGKRYLLPIVDRATQNAVLDGIFARLYNAKELPVTHDSATVIGSEVHVTPDEGTA